ncbi:MAG TPA: methylmalonyl-CoA epimerase [bacterium]|nr:methylmalonyl-CoA epimerase [bacterium]
MKLDHVGIAVRDLEDAVQLYAGAFGGRVVHREELPDEGVRLAFVETGGALLELLQPLRDSGPLAKFLQNRGEGLHHLAFEVSDIIRAIAEAGARGLRPVGDGPRLGARARLIAFLHPAAAHGVLVELVQRAP